LNGSNVISEKNSTAVFKFLTSFEQNELQQFTMSWGLFPDKYNDSVEFVYAAHSDKNNSNGTWIGKIGNFHIGYVHPPFFSKFEIQILDF